MVNKYGSMSYIVLSLVWITVQTQNIDYDRTTGGILTGYPWGNDSFGGHSNLIRAVDYSDVNGNQMSNNGNAGNMINPFQIKTNDESNTKSGSPFSSSHGGSGNSGIQTGHFSSASSGVGGINAGISRGPFTSTFNQRGSTSGESGAGSGGPFSSTHNQGGSTSGESGAGSGGPFASTFNQGGGSFGRSGTGSGGPFASTHNQGGSTSGESGAGSGGPFSSTHNQGGSTSGESGAGSGGPFASTFNQGGGSFGRSGTGSGGPFASTFNHGGSTSGGSGGPFASTLNQGGSTSGGSGAGSGGPFASTFDHGGSTSGGSGGPFASTFNQDGSTSGGSGTGSGGPFASTFNQGGGTFGGSGTGSGGPFASTFDHGGSTSGGSGGPFASTFNQDGSTSVESGAGSGGPFATNSVHAKGSPFSVSAESNRNVGGSGGASPFSSGMGRTGEGISGVSDRLTSGPGGLAGGDFMSKNVSLLMVHDYSQDIRRGDNGGIGEPGNYQGVDNSRFDTSEYQNMLKSLFHAGKDTTALGTPFDGTGYDYDNSGRPNAHVNAGQEASIGSYASTDMSTYADNSGTAGSQNLRFHSKDDTQFPLDNYSGGSLKNSNAGTSANSITEGSYSNSFSVNNYDTHNINQGQASHDNTRGPFSTDSKYNSGGNSGNSDWATGSSPFSPSKYENTGSNGEGPFSSNQASPGKGQNPFETSKYQNTGSYNDGQNFYTGSGSSYSSHSSSQYETPFESDNYNDLLGNPFKSDSHFESTKQNFNSPFESKNGYRPSSNYGHGESMGYSNQGYGTTNSDPGGDPFKQGGHTVHGPGMKG